MTTAAACLLGIAKKATRPIVPPSVIGGGQDSFGDLSEGNANKIGERDDQSDETTSWIVSECGERSFPRVVGGREFTKQGPTSQLKRVNQVTDSKLSFIIRQSKLV